MPWFIQQWKGKPGPPQDAGLIVELSRVTADSQLQVRDGRGRLLAETGTRSPGANRTGFLGGLVQVSRLAGATTVLSAPTEDDYPAAALGPDGELIVAYVAFTHGEGYRKPPESARTAQGLGRPGQPDRRRPGDAAGVRGRQVDRPAARHPARPGRLPNGRSRRRLPAATWVFWSANDGENWDLYARSREDGKWSDR